jgi:threonine/homoserine/homoserine lactone efflux protein
LLPRPRNDLSGECWSERGYRKALETIFGTNFASLILIFISVLILKGFLTIDENYLKAIRILGCLYIAYLGYSIIKEVLQAPHPTAIQTVSTQSGGFKKAFWWEFPIQKILFSFRLFSHSLFISRRTSISV